MIGITLCHKKIQNDITNEEEYLKQGKSLKIFLIRNAISYFALTIFVCPRNVFS